MSCCNVQSSVKPAHTESTRKFAKMVRKKELRAKKEGEKTTWDVVEEAFVHAGQRAAEMTGIAMDDAPIMDERVKEQLMLEGAAMRLHSSLAAGMQDSITQCEKLDTLLAEAHEKLNCPETAACVAAMTEFRQKGLILLSNFAATALADIDMAHIAQIAKDAHFGAGDCAGECEKSDS
jgi:hypothetical protein